MDHLDFVDAVRFLADRAGITLHEDAETGRDHKRRSELLDAMERAVTWYHERLLAAPDAGPARDYLRSRGYDGDVVRQFRLGWAPDDWDALAKALKLPEKVLSDSGLGFVNRRGRAQDFFRGPRPVPDLRPVGTARRAGRTHPAGTTRGGTAAAARAEVQELTGVADLFEAPHALRAQLGEARCHRAGRGRRVRGLHRRHRVLPGRRAVGGGDVRHRAGRRALHAVAQLRQAHRARLRRRRGRAERDVARLRVGAQARGRRRGGRAARAAATRGTWPRTDPGALATAIREARPFLQFRVDRMLGPATSRRPRAGPGRPRPR